METVRIFKHSSIAYDILYYETIRYEYLRTVLLIDTTSSTTSLLHHEVVGAKKDAIATQYD